MVQERCQNSHVQVNDIHQEIKVNLIRKITQNSITASMFEVNRCNKQESGQLRKYSDLVPNSMQIQIRQHWRLRQKSSDFMFGPIKYLRRCNLNSQDIRRHDEGVYRCRVDFRTSQTQSFRYNLSVISKLTLIYGIGLWQTFKG